MSPKYICRKCDQDLDGAVSAEREQELDVLRVWWDPKDVTGEAWSVRVLCDQGHENVFSGTGNG